MRYDILIIGGGPIGGHAALRIAEAGYEVAVLEEHKEVGVPVQCAGIFSPKVLDIVGCENTVLGRIKGAEILSPGGSKLSLKSKHVQAVVVDRAKFDREILSKAVRKGVHLVLDAKALKGRKSKDGVEVIALHNARKDISKAKLLIGADGVQSNVARWFELPRAPAVLSGFQAEMSGAGLEADRVSVFLGTKVAPGFFAWAIPAGDTARIGLCSTEGGAREHFKKLVANHFPDARPLGYNAGAIPIGMLRRTCADRAMLVGDAACQVKSTSGGGIYMGLMGAEHCAKTAIESLKKGDFSERFLSIYHKRWMGDIGKELKRDWLLFRLFQTFDDDRIERGLALLNKPGIIKLIEEKGDIDYPSKLALALVRKQPKLLTFASSALKDFMLG